MVNEQWLLDCIQCGQWLPESAYLIHCAPHPHNLENIQNKSTPVPLMYSHVHVVTDNHKNNSDSSNHQMDDNNDLVVAMNKNSGEKNHINNENGIQEKAFTYNNHSFTWNEIVHYLSELFHTRDGNEQ
jgi:hypothetical protein